MTKSNASSSISQLVLSDVPPSLEKWVALVNGAYRGDSGRRGWTTEADLLEGVRLTLEDGEQLLRDPTKKILFWSSESDGGPSSLRACVCLENHGEVATLGMLTVSPDHQGEGLGKRVLETSEAWVRKNWPQIHSMEMTVLSVRDELIQFYLRRGYVLTEERRPFPGYLEPERFGRPQQSGLEFCVLRKSLLKA